MGPVEKRRAIGGDDEGSRPKKEKPKPQEEKTAKAAKRARQEDDSAEKTGATKFHKDDAGTRQVAAQSEVPAQEEKSIYHLPRDVLRLIMRKLPFNDLCSFQVTGRHVYERTTREIVKLAQLQHFLSLVENELKIKLQPIPDRVQQVLLASPSVLQLHSGCLRILSERLDTLTDEQLDALSKCCETDPVCKEIYPLVEAIVKLSQVSDRQFEILYKFAGADAVEELLMSACKKAESIQDPEVRRSALETTGGAFMSLALRELNIKSLGTLDGFDLSKWSDPFLSKAIQDKSEAVSRYLEQCKKNLNLAGAAATEMLPVVYMLELPIYACGSLEKKFEACLDESITLFPTRDDGIADWSNWLAACGLFDEAAKLCDRLPEEKKAAVLAEIPGVKIKFCKLALENYISKDRHPELLAPKEWDAVLAMVAELDIESLNSIKDLFIRVEEITDPELAAKVKKGYRI